MMKNEEAEKELPPQIFIRSKRPIMNSFLLKHLATKTASKVFAALLNGYNLSYKN